jgi:DNA primase
VDFNEIKARVKIIDVLAKRGIALRYNGEWGSAPCPLPSHKPNDKSRTFQVNVPQNFFKCWSASCNEKAGKKGGDVINLVAMLDNCTEYQAAQKLSEMFQIKTAEQIAQRSKNETSKGTESNLTSSVGEVKYTEMVRVWFEELSALREGETPEAYRKRVLRGVTSELLKNYQAGRANRSL